MIKGLASKLIVKIIFKIVNVKSLAEHITHNGRYEDTTTRLVGGAGTAKGAGPAPVHGG